MMDSERELLINQFLDYSRGKREVAIRYLEESGWDVARAKDTYWREVVLASDIE